MNCKSFKLRYGKEAKYPPASAACFLSSRKDESVVFPTHLEMTLPNLIQFVLRYGTSALKLETGLSICSKTCIQNNLDSTSKNIQVLRQYITQIRQAIVAIRK